MALKPHPKKLPSANSSRCPSLRQKALCFILENPACQPSLQADENLPSSTFFELDERHATTKRSEPPRNYRVWGPTDGNRVSFLHRDNAKVNAAFSYPPWAT